MYDFEMELDGNLLGPEAQGRKYFSGQFDTKFLSQIYCQILFYFLNLKKH